MNLAFRPLTVGEKIDISRNRLAYFAKTQAPEIVVKLEESNLARLIGLARRNACNGFERLAQAVGL